MYIIHLYITHICPWWVHLFVFGAQRSGQKIRGMCWGGGRGKGGKVSSDSGFIYTRIS